jgi:hypothetical protein
MFSSDFLSLSVNINYSQHGEKHGYCEYKIMVSSDRKCHIDIGGGNVYIELFYQFTSDKLFRHLINLRHKYRILTLYYTF